MSSMIRRRNNLAYAASRAGNATALLWLVALQCRTMAVFADRREIWLIVAACAWAAAFSPFFFDFRGPLLRAIFER